jgi:quercetin dioxygenase-like cupin family protein
MKTKLNRLGTACIGLGAAVLCMAQAGTSRLHAQAAPAMAKPAAKEHGRVVFSHPLPVLDGRRLKATVVEVDYGPGGASPPHSHPCPVIGYVVSGAIRTQVKGGPEEIVKAGQSFYEAPNGVHLVSANASRTEPAKLLAYFVCDGDAPLSTPVGSSAKPGGN